MYWYDISQWDNERTHLILWTFSSFLVLVCFLVPTLITFPYFCLYSHMIFMLFFLKYKKNLLTLYNLAYFKTCTKLKVVCNMKCMYIYCKLCTETIYKFVLLKIKLVCKRFQTWCTLNNFISMKDKKNWFHFPCNQE